MSPAAPVRACAVMGCSHPAPCPEHSRKPSQYPSRKLTTTQQGYGYDWQRWTDWYRDEQVRQAVPDAGLCGSRLPGAPPTTDSLCAQQGLTIRGRVVDHIRPVRDRFDPDFMNPLAVQLLCDGAVQGGNACHDRKRQREANAK